MYSSPHSKDVVYTIGLRENEAEGVLGQYYFQASVNVANFNQSLAPYCALYVLVVYDGILRIKNNSADTIIGCASKEDVMRVPMRHDVSYRELHRIYGGTFGQRFKDFIVNKAWPAIKKYGPTVLKAALPLLGVGEGDGAYAGAYAGGMLQGGKAMSASQMKRMLKKR